jgi:hypothetical protein
VHESLAFPLAYSTAGGCVTPSDSGTVTCLDKDQVVSHTKHMEKKPTITRVNTNLKRVLIYRENFDYEFYDNIPGKYPSDRTWDGTVNLTQPPSLSTVFEVVDEANLISYLEADPKVTDYYFRDVVDDLVEEENEQGEEMTTELFNLYRCLRGEIEWDENLFV